jgi:hypothetical protein
VENDTDEQRIQEQRKRVSATGQAAPSNTAKLTPPVSKSTALPPGAKSNTSKDQLKLWIRSQYHIMAFNSQGFIGWKAFAKGLIAALPNRSEKEISAALQE